MHSGIIDNETAENLTKIFSKNFVIFLQEQIYLKKFKGKKTYVNGVYHGKIISFINTSNTWQPYFKIV